MKLPNFNEFEPFLALRAMMGVTENVVLGGVEWQALSTEGLDLLDLSEVVPNAAGELVFKGRRVLVYIRDQYPRRGAASQSPEHTGYRFHVADCQKLQEMRDAKRYERYVVTDRRDGRFVITWGQPNAEFRPKHEVALHVCRFCLGALNWQGYNSKPQFQKDAIWEQFTPAEYFAGHTTLIEDLPRKNELTQPENVYTKNSKENTSKLREERKYTCEECGFRPLYADGRQFLEAHHINGQKGDNRPENLKLLCTECHSKAPMHEHYALSPRVAEFKEWKRRKKPLAYVTVRP